MSAPFIGREEELEGLKKLLKKDGSSLVVIEGRRRIGKSRLVKEFAKGHTFYEFSGLAPNESTTLQSQLDDFARQISMQTGMPEIKADDWSKLFLLLAEKIKQGRMIVLFDEITWMGSKDPDFLEKFKRAWDMHFKNNPKLIFILCGSMSIWIEKNILSSTGFVGRISYRLSLEELPLSACNQFWKKTGDKISSYEKLKILSVTGGVPRYLEEIKPTLSAEENIKDMCFSRGGPLVNEFKEVFSDLFSKRSATYKKNVQILASGSLEIKKICGQLKIQQTGYISECLDDLIKSGFVTRDYTWHLKSGEISRLSHYRLSDNYLRFYLKYIDKYRLKIENNEFALKSITSLPGWEGVMGLQFENLVLKNRAYIKNSLRVRPDEIVSDNPYFQRKTVQGPGCQIDYLIETKFGTLYVCEIKFTKHEIGLEVIGEMRKKLLSFKYPKGFSCRPVLIHANGIKDEVVESDYFSDIIDFGELLS